MAYTPPGQTRERVYRYVRERLLAGSPPTMREVREHLGFRSVESARIHLEALAREGRLVKLPGQSRGYRLPGVDTGAPPTVLVPVLGRVAAGGFEEAVEDPEGWLPLPSTLPREQLFALRVRGESMRDAGILPRDVVLVHRQADARSGDVVVALVEGEATVKTLRRRGRQVVLEPANPDFEPLTPDPAELVLLGRVVEVHRYLESSPLIDAPGESVRST